MAAAHDDDRRHRRHLVEIAPQRKPLLLQLRFVPVAVGNDDLARFRALDPIAHGLQHIVEAPGAREIDPRPASCVVKMVVGEPWDYCHAVEIDLLRVRPREPTHRFVRTDSGELVAGDRDCLRVRELVVDGNDFGVVVDDVWSLRGTLALALGRQHRREHDEQDRGRCRNDQPLAMHGGFFRRDSTCLNGCSL